MQVAAAAQDSTAGSHRYAAAAVLILRSDPPLASLDVETAKGVYRVAVLQVAVADARPVVFHISEMCGQELRGKDPRGLALNSAAPGNGRLDLCKKQRVVMDAMRTMPGLYHTPADLYTWLKSPAGAPVKRRHSVSRIGVVGIRNAADALVQACMYVQQHCSLW